MIDSHCHLEQKEYDENRDEIIKTCKKKLKHIISSCAHPQDIELTLDLYKKYKPFLQICIGLHPEFIREISDKDIKKIVDVVKSHRKKIVAIGEVGLDFHYIKESEWQEKQKILFIIMIKLAKKLDLPLVVHSRDATLECIEILEQQGMKNKKVLMHLFQEKNLLSRIVENGWMISIGPGILRSKNIKKIAKNVPLKNLVLETDSPWFAQLGQKYGTPHNIKIAMEKVAEIKKISISEVEKQTDLNAFAFFRLN